MKKRHSKFLLPGILMVGVVLRAPFAVLPVVLGDIAKGLQVPVNSLGLLTSLPLIMFALCSAFSPRLAQKVGLEKLFTIAMMKVLPILIPFIFKSLSLENTKLFV